MESKTVFKLFAVSPPGIEEITLSELEELGIEGKVVPGGVEFKGSLRELYLTNLWLRTANRVLVRVANFRVKTFAELVKRVSRYPWDIYFPSSCKVKIRVTTKKSKLYHSLAVAERVLRGINNRLKGYSIEKANFEDEGTSIVVRLENDICTISVNSSGAPLYKRGYKVADVDAPLRENLAAAMVLASNWDGSLPLIDPFCGSGTILIEAGLIGANIPPGKFRDFAFKHWKNFDESLWNNILKDSESKRKDFPEVLGFDISEKAVSATKKNSEKAGVPLNVKKASFPKEGLPEIAFIVTNPPYGKRVKVSAEKVYYQFGKWIKGNFSACKCFFLSPDDFLAKKTGLKVERLLTFDNGGIKVGLYKG